MPDNNQPSGYLLVALVATGGFMGGVGSNKINSPHDLIDANHIELQFEIKQLNRGLDECRRDIRYLNRGSVPEIPYMYEPMRGEK